MDVVAIGELLIDFSPVSTNASGYPTLSANPGGAPANFLAALSKYGIETAFIGKVGNDTFGQLLANTLSNAGVSTEGLVLSNDVFTTLAFVTLDEQGERSFSFARKPGADTRLCTNEINFSLIDSARVLHFGTLSLTDEPARSATKAAVEYAKRAGKLISFDPNLRLLLWHDPEAAKNAILWGLHQADIVKISIDEVEFLWDCDAKTAAQKLLSEFGAKLVFVTLGADGCYFENPICSGSTCYNGRLNVIDTTGAGDIFGGSAMSRILKLNKPPEKLTYSELLSIADFACTAASLSTQKIGGISSVYDEKEVMQALIQNIRSDVSI